MTSVSAGHIILTPTQPVGSGRLQWGSNPESPQQESRALPTELPPPPPRETDRQREREGERKTEREGEINRTNTETETNAEADRQK